MHRLTDATGAQGFFLPVPFIADSVADKQVLMAQRSARDALDRARGADLCYVGIGAIGTEHPMFMESMGLLGQHEVEALRQVGATGEIGGHFFNADGTMLDTDINRRTIGLSLDELRGRETIAVAGGHEKIGAIRAVLRGGVLDGLIVDENAAAGLCERERTVASASENTSSVNHGADEPSSARGRT